MSYCIPVVSSRKGKGASRKRASECALCARFYNFHPYNHLQIQIGHCAPYSRPPASSTTLDGKVTFIHDPWHPSIGHTAAGWTRPRTAQMDRDAGGRACTCLPFLLPFRPRPRPTGNVGTSHETVALGPPPRLLAAPPLSPGHDAVPKPPPEDAPRLRLQRLYTVLYGSAAMAHSTLQVGG